MRPTPARCTFALIALALGSVALGAPSDFDPTFGGSPVPGIRTVPIGDMFSTLPNDLVLLPSGKILVAGRASIAGKISSAFLRLGATGEPDATFGTMGVRTLLGRAAYAVALLPGGRFLAGVGGASDLRLQRFAANGGLDGTFGTNGTATVPVPAGPGGAWTDGLSYGDVAVQPDGAVLVLDSLICCGDTDTNFALARFTASGVLDRAFGTGGVVRGGWNAAETQGVAYAMALDSFGRILVAGGGGGPGWTIGRFLPNGRPDPSFGTGGEARAPVGTSFGQIEALHLLPDGRILATGEAFHGGTIGRVFTLARFATNGSLDPTFGPDGTGYAVFNPSVTSTKQSTAHALVVQPSGKIVLGGYADVDDRPLYADFRFTLVRFSAEGVLDTGFGDGGRVYGPAGGERVRALALQPDGKIVGVGPTSSFASAFIVARWQGDPPPPTTTTTTTLPPGGCAVEPAAATFASLRCRLGALRGRLAAAPPVERLTKAVDAAGANVGAADDGCRTGDLRPARKRLRRGVRSLQRAHRLLRSRKTRSLPDALRTELLERVDALRADGKSRARELRCPDDASTA